MTPSNFKQILSKREGIGDKYNSLFNFLDSILEFLHIVPRISMSCRSTKFENLENSQVVHFVSRFFVDKKMDNPIEKFDHPRRNNSVGPYTIKRSVREIFANQYLEMKPNSQSNGNNF
ncbi:hypothetical protein HPP92_027448 [Vanilla planifolia]|uniref:Uncharacterized protein n=1 Tax=Vanilla planifolia TaxID=51239 RepID=A0A835P939_VANPL|nr:hypothetical protein HPP92_027448 [Vanilla planifolia]